MTTGIIICIVLIIIFIIMGLVCVMKEEPMAALWAGLFALITLVILFYEIKDVKENIEPQGYDVTYPVTIYDVTDFQIDTVMNVNGIDTSKTYVITYWK